MARAIPAAATRAPGASATATSCARLRSERPEHGEIVRGRQGQPGHALAHDDQHREGHDDPEQQQRQRLQ